MKQFVPVLCLFLAILLPVVTVHAGGVDPGDMPQQETQARDKVSARPAQTSAAVSKARQAVAPAVEDVRIAPQRPRSAAAVKQGEWMLGSREGGCAPLSAVSRKVKNIGRFKTPQEFARQMQQRGYQAFALDIGDVPDQVVRVRVPDLDLDLTFVSTGMCR